MFESLKRPPRLGKEEFSSKEPRLRGDLIDAQFDLLEDRSFPVIVLLTGVDVLGRSAATRQLLSWMDPRHIRPYAVARPSDEERQHPRMWRFWRALPAKGKVGIYLSTWYEGPTSDYFLGRIGKKQFRSRLEEIVGFERLLADEGALFQKFWFFRPKEEELKGLKKIDKDNGAAWKASKHERELAKEFAERYDNAIEIFQEILQKTSTSHAPWVALASADARYRDYTIGQTLAEAIRKRLAAPAQTATTQEKTHPNGLTAPNILSSLNLSKALPQAKYKKRLKNAQQRLTALTLAKNFEKRSLVAVFEGNDAAGKGGAIRRVVQALDPRMTRVIPIAAPSDEEKAHPYLWRFWRHIPAKGRVTVFDRSWYGRVLVERVEGFAAENEWKRAYEEIRDFESQLADYGTIVVKFWLSIDRDEQLKRFKEREKVGYKRYKITEEDWRNRDNWDAYAQAVHDMVEHTDTPRVRWNLIEANDKYYARVKVVEAIAARIEDSL